MSVVRDRPRYGERDDVKASSWDADSSRPRVVAAVDGSERSLDVLGQAAYESLRRGMPVRLVTAYTAQPGSQRLRTVEQAMVAQRRLHELARRHYPWMGDVQRVVRRGTLSALLAEATRPGDVLVVGTTTGRTAAGLVDRAPCPVVIAPVQTSTSRRVK